MTPERQADKRDTAAWQTGSEGNVPLYSKLHVWNALSTRMLCGVAPNWRIGNFGSNHSGRCTRCFEIAAGDGLEVNES